MTNLIFIPGLLCDESLYRPVIKAFKGDHDIQIENVSTHNSIDGFAKNICEKISNDVVLIGFSFGAWIALHSYFMLKNYCKGVVLISSAPGNLTDSTKQRLSSYIDDISSGNFEAFVEDDYEHDMSVKNKSDEHLKDMFMDMVNRQGPDVAMSQLNAMLEFKSGFNDLSEITCPILLIRGEDDQSVNIPKQEKMLQEISQSELVVIPNAAHYVPLENPTITALEIESWMSRHGI